VLKESLNTIQVRWRRHYNHARPHSALGDRSPSHFAAKYAAAAERFALIRVDKASGVPPQWFAARAKNAALEPVPRLPENRQYRRTEFYGWYNMAIIMMSLTAAVAAMFLFWISKTGWSDANRQCSLRL